MPELSESVPTAAIAVEIKDENSLLKANRELLGSTDFGTERLLPLYDAAVKAAPSLKNVKLIPIDYSKDKRIGFARQRMRFEGGIHEVHVQIGSEALTEAQSKLDRISAALIAEMLGIKPGEMTAEQLVEFAFFHELGHAFEFIKHDSHPGHYARFMRDERRKLPVPDMPPHFLYTEEGRRIVAGMWDRLQRRWGVTTYDQLVELQSKAYRRMKHEAAADRFAVHMIRNNDARKGVARKIFQKSFSHASAQNSNNI